MTPSGYESLGALASRPAELGERLGSQAREVLHEARPRLRGWFHAALAPPTVVAGGVLIARSPASHLRIGVTVFVLSAVVLFTVSALYHRRRWSPRNKALLRRFDHANIFVHIAGTYTAFALLFLEPVRAALLLTVVWIGAGVGIGLRVYWMDAPRWLHTPLYGLVASAALLFSADFRAHAGDPAITLMAVGGVVYLLGAVVYGVQRPNPIPRWLGFHEVFHALTVVAFTAHFIGVYLAATALA